MTKHKTQIVDRQIVKATWDISMLRADLEDQSKLNVSDNPDKVLAYFMENIYPGLAACTTPLPTLNEAYSMTPSDLDAWYLQARKVNPAWFDDSELTEEYITFSDGKKITVLSKRPSTLMKRAALEVAVEEGATLENIRREVFRSIYYPKLAGCSVGDVPDELTARSEMTMEDLNLWYEACKRQCPEWFVSLEELAAQNQAEQNGLKKKEETPV